jgi:hypothetical protein
LCFLSIKTRKKPLDFALKFTNFFSSPFAPFKGLFLVCLRRTGRTVSADSQKRFCQAPPIAPQNIHSMDIYPRITVRASLSLSAAIPKTQIHARAKQGHLCF